MVGQVLISALMALVVANSCEAVFFGPPTASQSPNRVSQSKGLEYMELYDVLNDYLIKKVETDDLDDNFKAIEKLLADYKKTEESKLNKALRLFVPTAKAHSYDNKLMLEAINLLKSLSELYISQRQCNLKSYNILHENYNAAYGLPQWNYAKTLADRRVNKIVKNFLVEHAKSCKSAYFNLYREQIKQVDGAAKEVAESLIKNLVHTNKKEQAEETLSNSQNLLNFSQEYSMTHKVVRDPVFCLNELRRLAKDDPNAKYIEPVDTVYLGKSIREVNVSKLEALFEKHIRKPCFEYVLKLEGVFKPADYDTRTIEVPAEETERDFYLAWGAFELCDVVVSHKDAIPFNVANYENRMVKSGQPF